MKLPFLKQWLPRMASKLIKLRWPPYHVHKGAVYTHFLKTVFKYNNQRKDLMDKGIIDAKWIHIMNSDIRDNIVREGLIDLAHLLRLCSHTLVSQRLMIATD